MRLILTFDQGIIAPDLRVESVHVTEKEARRVEVVTFARVVR